MRFVLLAALGLALGLACGGKHEECYDCDCGSGPFQLNGTVKTTDRPELAGATVEVWNGTFKLSGTRDGKPWSATYQAMVSRPR